MIKHVRVPYRRKDIHLLNKITQKSNYTNSTSEALYLRRKHKVTTIHTDRKRIKYNCFRGIKMFMKLSIVIYIVLNNGRGNE